VTAGRVVQPEDGSGQRGIRWRQDGDKIRNKNCGGCFADSLEAKARARHRLESGPSESRRLRGTESGPLVDGSGQTKIVPLRARLSDSF
jgi:hypothetical protein